MLLRFKTKLILIFIIVFFNLAAGAIASADVSFTGQINADNVNVRADATVSSPIACVLPKGQMVDVVEEAYDWYKIRLPKEAPSYIKKDLVDCINTDSVNPEKCLGAKVVKDRINIRLGPSESSWIVGKVNKLTVVNILSTDGVWYKITPVYTSFCWVNKKFINKYIPVLVKKEEMVGAVKDTNSPESAQLVLEGKVSPYGIVLWRKATHKLITAENKVYFLKGNRKNLDSLNYSQVKVTGKLISPQDSKYPLVEINTIEVLN
ncbi:MAG: SH3 domain-containing protein [Candidatus Omnitrophota bacterium]